jgi:hypothetical protein
MRFVSRGARDAVPFCTVHFEVLVLRRRGVSFNVPLAVQVLSQRAHGAIVTAQLLSEPRFELRLLLGWHRE